MSRRIVCVGANLESKVALDRLMEDDVNVVGLVTLPPGESNGVSDYRDLHDHAQRSSISVIDTKNINSQETITEIERLAPDYIFILGWSQILKNEFLEIPKYFVVGSHPTPLPKKRGRAPVPWMILDGDRESAVTLFRIRPGVDDGPVLIQRFFTIPERAYAREVYQRVSETLGESFSSLYRELCAGAVAEMEQDDSEATYRGKRVPEDGYLDFFRSVYDLDRLIRASSEPFPGAYAYYIDQPVRIWRSDFYEGPEMRGTAGQILHKEDGALIVQAGDGCIELSCFTIEGEAVPLSLFKVGNRFNFRTMDEIASLRERVADLENTINDILEGK